MVGKFNAARVNESPEEIDYVERAAPAALTWGDLADRVAVESPARRLQRELEQSLSEPQTERWSARRALAFMFISSAVLWTGIIWAAQKLI